ncbi:DAPG hydrolase family protein [Sulfitobacter pontiacus]|uniref:DAPG hydrolase family protein n=1 Tax=Sulfitobacter pontiacus TaxID=60137 RepID=UPI0030EE02C5
MMKWIVGGAVVFALGVGIFGLPPFSGQPTAGFAEGEPGFETGVKRLPNGIYEVSVRTPMPRVSPEMVGWWFGDYMETTEHYRRWFPDAHLWMDWENKVDGQFIGASHLVHEYIGEDLNKLRIQFVEPEEVLGEVNLADGDVAVCARVGLLEEPIYGGEMCHIVRNVEGGAEMRSRFWLGMVAAREGNEAVPSVIGTLGNTYLARLLTVKEASATALLNHCFDEMTILAGFLPKLYADAQG